LYSFENMSEYFIPTKTLKEYQIDGNMMAIHHLIRYQWVTEFLKDITPNTIIDMACGAGYGTYQVGKELPYATVVGIDYDSDAIDYARRHFRLPNVNYLVGNVLEWEFGDYDCVISFDTIEHLSHREIMMENIVNHVSTCLILSTPCGHNIDIFSPEWSDHKIEYSAASLYNFLSRYFRKIIRPECDDFPHLEAFYMIDYLLRLNPVICYDPIRILNNPYRN